MCIRDSWSCDRVYTRDPRPRAERPGLRTAHHRDIRAAARRVRGAHVPVLLRALPDAVLPAAGGLRGARRRDVRRRRRDGRVSDRRPLTEQLLERPPESPADWSAAALDERPAAGPAPPDTGSGDGRVVTFYRHGRDGELRPLTV